jgi:hypothetical protein
MFGFCLYAPGSAFAAATYAAQFRLVTLPVAAVTVVYGLEVCTIPSGLPDRRPR